jgi:hypothetical protein
MPRVCTICSHEKRSEIDAALLADEPYRHIAARFGTSTGALQRHRAEHLPVAMVKAQEAAEVAQADALTTELQRCMNRVNLLFDACDRWLRDPDNPSQYDIGPRADDVMVTYLESDPEDEDKKVRKKARLSKLLAIVEESDRTVTLVEVKHADPRELILKTAQRLQGHLELLAKLMGELQQEGTVSVLIAPEWLALRARLIEALGPYPEAREAVLRSLN